MIHKYISEGSQSKIHFYEQDIKIGTIDIQKKYNNDNTLCLWNFHIINEHQNKGYGKEAIKLICELYKNKTLWLWVNSHNKPALKIYIKLGFRIDLDYIKRIEPRKLSDTKRIEMIKYNT